MTCTVLYTSDGVWPHSVELSLREPFYVGELGRTISFTTGVMFQTENTDTRTIKVREPIKIVTINYKAALDP